MEYLPFMPADYASGSYLKIGDQSYSIAAQIAEVRLMTLIAGQSPLYR